MSGQYVPPFVIASIVNTARKLDISFEAVFAEEGLDIQQFVNNEAQATVEQFNELILRVVRRSKVGPIGLLVGHDLLFEYLPEFETFITTAESPRVAIRAIDLIAHIMKPDVEIKVQESEQEVVALCHVNASWTEEIRSLYVEVIFSIIHRFGLMILSDRYELNKIVLEHKLNDALGYYHGQFGTVIEAGSTHNAMVFPAHILDLPVNRSLPRVNRDTEKLLITKLKSIQIESTIKEQVEALLLEKDNLSGGVEDIAQRLDTSVRGLQRKLKEAGTSFSELQKDCRMTLASELLINSELPIESVAKQLGFSDRRSFTRIFTKRYGVSPMGYRKKMQI